MGISSFEILLYYFQCKDFYLFSETKSTRRHAQQERQRGENLKQTALSEEPDAELDPTTLRPRPEPKPRLRCVNQVRHPSTPLLFSIYTTSL